VSSIEERIVRLKFDNQAFEQGVATSRNSLGQFTKQLETPVSTKGLDGISEGIAKASDNLGKLASDSQKDFGEVDNASKKLSLDGIGNGIAAVSDKFKAMSIVGVTDGCWCRFENFSGIDQGYRQPRGIVWLKFRAGIWRHVPAFAGDIRRSSFARGLELSRQRRYGWHRIPAGSRPNR
jgi:hypothetical protein